MKRIHPLRIDLVSGKRDATDGIRTGDDPATYQGGVEPGQPCYRHVFRLSADRIDYHVRFCSGCTGDETLTPSKKDRFQLDDRAWTALQDVLPRLLATHAPDWTDQGEHDPGVTMLELAAFLIQELSRRDAIPARAGTAVSRIEHVLSQLPWRPAVEVSVDGERWEFVDSLRDAQPDALVFSVDENGALVFGDGVHGRRPQSGSRVTACFRPGGDDSTISLQAAWPLPARVYTVTTGAGAAFQFEASDVVGESWSGAKRPRYFDGRLLTASDFRDEQEYHLRKHREHQAALHGSGIVTGLRVARTDDGAAVTIGAGRAIDAEGRDLRLSEDLSVPMPADASSPAYVVLEYAERATDPAPTTGDPTATRIEEGCRVLVSGAYHGGVALARLVRTEHGWDVDASHPPTRVR